LRAEAVVMTLSIKNRMEVAGKYEFESQLERDEIDKFWMHTVSYFYP
jgi:hypothetical protein